MSFTLYNISKIFEQAIAKLEAAESEADYYDAEVTLHAIEAAKDDKLEACCCYLKNLRAEEELISSEIDKLRAKQEAAAARVEKFEKYLAGCLGVDEKWKRGVHSISFRKSEAVKIIDSETIPSAYLREILKYEADKTQIKTDLKMGAKIPGVELEIRHNLQVK